jgi:hypothetical protein
MMQVNESLRSLSARLHRFYFGPVSIYPFVLCRILLGSIFFLAYTLFFPAVTAIWGPRGVTHFYLEQLARNYAVPVAPLAWTETHVWFVYALLLITAVTFAAGFMTRISGIVVVLCHIVFAESRFHTWGWSPTIIPFAVYLVLGNAGARFSVDAWLRRRRAPTAGETETITAWPLRLFQTHVLAIYMAASWHRIDDPGWLRGDVLFEVMTSEVWTRVTIDLLPYRAVLQLATWASLIVELLAPLALCWRRTRTGFVLLLAVLHIGLELFGRLGWWQPLMLTLLVVFWPDGAAERLIRRLERALSGSRTRCPPVPLREKEHTVTDVDEPRK